MPYNLPVELVRLLIEHGSTLVSLTLVNKHYNCIVTPILYERISINGPRTLKALRDTMVTGHPSLREYPRFLRLQDMSAAPYMPRDRQFIIKDLLLHVPSVVDLELSFDTDTILYLARDTKYPFALRSLRATPPKEAAFVEFLKTQPQIERIVFYGDPGEADLYPVPGWYGVASPLEPHILPNLKTVQGNKVNVCFLVPYRPVTSVSVHLFQEDLGFHKMLAKASAPLERLSECMQLHEAPWETGIVSQCLPSLNFCRTSLSEYSLHVKAFPPHLDGRSVLACLKSSNAPSYGLGEIRECLSAFSELKVFRLRIGWDDKHDLTHEFRDSVPELSQFERWKESCPKLEQVNISGIILKR